MTKLQWSRALAALILLLPLAFSCQGDEKFRFPSVELLRVPPGAQLSLDEAAASGDWQTLENSSPNFGYSRDTTWFRFDVPAESQIDLLEITYSQLDHIAFYLIANGELAETFTTGDRYPFTQRPILNRHFLFPFSSETSDNRQILLEVRTTGTLQVPMVLWNTQAFFEHASVEEQLHAVYYGILISVIFFNLFVFIALREHVYLLYVLSTLGYLLLIGNLNGTAFHLIWPGNPELQNRATLFTVPLAVMFTLLFSRSFLRLKQTGPLLNRIVLGFVTLNAAMVIITGLIDYNSAIRLTVAIAIPSTLLLTIIGPLQWVRRNPQAGYYTIASGALSLGSAITAANKYGLLPNNFITTYGMEIGSALEAILLALALAARLYQERQDKVKAREAELAAMTARRSAELKLIESALHNSLTGLPNRASFEMQANDLIRQAPDTRHGIVVIHLNNLKSVTKTLGHQNSDRILELAARSLNAITRELPGIISLGQHNGRNFFVACLDPETFACVVDASISENARRSVLSALEAIRSPIDYLGMQVPLNAQLGVAVSPIHGADATSLIRRAVIAEGSDRAQERGIAYYKLSRDSFSAGRLTMASELQKALANNELKLYLQPKLNLATGQIAGLEALIRWPERNPSVGADEIIMLAEQTGLIKPLTRWALEQSLQLRNCLLENGQRFKLSVNISPNNLREPDFPLFVKRLMSAHPQHGGAIIFEITETSMMQDPVNALKALNSLTNAGIPVSIDDFGSGYSSLSYIKQLPASEIKIDRSLITDLATREEDRVIVQTTIDMCHSLGYLVVAEGVEDEATANLLKGMGCDMIQGYLLSRPLPLEKMLTWLTDRHEAASMQRAPG
ncbi:diguanylate cyclase/phosphodiesterase [Marinobacter antarcticus]|uniref:Diguanylate cyclase/phosphodiesterase n=1 Tax=Marinobacter antarcticus TaxID=564117 RepID=A0A1M6QGT9_9GAMM|nr:EAL domain-containing protein [Marinobacter antarcticus]SHK19320.1 diguanylate cyclase/phosphodiesterase [Marinobacter antarcticus]